jgi:hypothetical protein
MPIKSLAELTLATWREYLGSHFSLRYGDGKAEELTLIEAANLGGGRPVAAGKREPYTLIFRAPSRDFLTPQRIYPLSHPALGELEIFLVPIGPDESGMRFEAIFG